MTAVRIRDAETADLETITDIYNHGRGCTPPRSGTRRRVDLTDRTSWLRRPHRPRLSGHRRSRRLRRTGIRVVRAVAPAQRLPFSRSSIRVYVLGGQARSRDRHHADGRARRAPPEPQAMHVMIAGIESGNAASIALHETTGFRRGRTDAAGRGRKFGRWLDLSMLQLVLDDRAEPRRGILTMDLLQWFVDAFNSQWMPAWAGRRCSSVKSSANAFRASRGAPRRPCAARSGAWPVGHHRQSAAADRVPWLRPQPRTRRCRTLLGQAGRQIMFIAVRDLRLGPLAQTSTAVG